MLNPYDFSDALTDWQHAPNRGAKHVRAHLVADLLPNATALSDRTIAFVLPSGAYAVLLSTHAGLELLATLYEGAAVKASLNAKTLPKVLDALQIAGILKTQGVPRVEQPSDRSAHNIYTLTVRNGEIASCSCPARKPCKHMRRVEALFSLARPDVPQPTVSPSSGGQYSNSFHAPSRMRFFRHS